MAQRERKKGYGLRASTWTYSSHRPRPVSPLDGINIPSQLTFWYPTSSNTPRLLSRWLNGLLWKAWRTKGSLKCLKFAEIRPSRS